MRRLIILVVLLHLIVSMRPVQAAASGIDSLNTLLTLAREDQKNGKYSSAWMYYEQAARIDSTNPDIHLAIADVCFRMNRIAPAIRALEAAVMLRPADYTIQWQLVQQYYSLGQPEKVIGLLPPLHAHFAATPGWAYMMGKSYYSLQNPGKAAEYLKLCLHEEEKNAEAAYLLGRIMVKMENYTAAAPYFERSLALDSSQPSRYYELALVYSTLMNFDASMKLFQKAIKLGFKPGDDFYLNLAYTMAEAHKTDEALKIMREMLARRPGDLGLLGGLAEVCYHSGRYKEAIDYWDRVLEQDGKNAKALYQIGSAYIKMGSDQDGKRLCEQAIRLDPSLGVLKHAHQSPW